MPSLQQTQRLIQHLSPQQILQSSVLQLNSLMIEARILEELEQNPALELDEEELAPDGDEQSESEEDDADEDEEAETEAEIDWDELLNSPEDYNVARIEDHSKEDIELQIPASEVFVEKLSQQLVDLELSEKDLKIADEILGNVNNEGYLVVDPVLVADRMKVSGDRVEQVRRQVMQLNPPGIGALDLQECLLAQLDFAGGTSLARRMIADHFADFANRRYNRVLQALGCTEEQLQQAIEVVSHLNPKPGSGDASVVGEYIVPDILVDEVNGEWIVTLNDSSLPSMRISPVYLNMMIGRRHYDTETRQFVRRKVEAARWFIQAVQQRRETILRVMSTIIDRQDDFFHQGNGQLKPMVLRDIAEDIGMDISTISRVTNGKYVQTPNAIYELKYFFSEGMTTDQGEEVSTRIIKEELQKIIDSEDKQKPYNDEVLARLLNEQGYPVARRTVAKYREQLKLPVARLRREL